MKKIYVIENAKFDTKKIVAENMEEALSKYREFVYSVTKCNTDTDEIMDNIDACEYFDDFDCVM